MKKYKVAIIGSGSLATIIGESILRDLSKQYELLGILSRKIENAKKLANKLNSKAYNNIDEMIKDKPDYIVEAAVAQVVKDNGIKILKNGINFIPLSVGALADEVFKNKLEEAALNNNSKVYIPAGAVGGFDLLSSAMMMEDVKVSITTEKASESLDGAPHLQGKKLSRTKAEEIFTGTAKEAIDSFPKNVNVAVATALVTNGTKNTDVVIKSVPEMKNNKHSIKLVGNTIDVDVIIETTPSKDNPKSSSLAAYSVIGLLKNLACPIIF